MKKEAYDKKLKDLLQAKEINERKNMTENVIKKNKQEITRHEKRTRLAKRCILI